MGWWRGRGTFRVSEPQIVLANRRFSAVPALLSCSAIVRCMQHSLSFSLSYVPQGENSRSTETACRGSATPV